MKQRYRCTGDYVFALIGLAQGLGEVGDADGAAQLAERAVAQASKPAIYFKGPALLLGLRGLIGVLPKEIFHAHCVAALQACAIHESMRYSQMMQVELGLRSLWPAGSETADITCALFAPDVLPKVLARDLRRSVWADIAHVPAPLTVLEALWPQEPVLPEIAAECVGALAWALDAAQHPATPKVAARLQDDAPATPRE